jgi:LPXTG-site transpeptidase (sortase) family protein
VGSPTESISNNGSLDIGETWTWTYTYTATQMDIDNNGGGDGDIDNTATVSSNELNNTSDSAVVPISQSPSFSVVKQVSDDNATWQNSISLLVGDTVYYRVVLENTGNRTLTGVSVIDPACTLTRAADISGDNDNNFEVGEQWAYTCSVTAVAGTQINTATVDTNETGPQSDSADYVGVSPPNISKSFSPGTINAGETSTLTFTITNPNSSTDLLGVEFDDTFPTSPGAMVVALPANASSSCGGAISASPGAGSISFSGATLIAGSNCTVSVDVMAPIDGLYANFSETVTSSNGGTGNRASASLIAGAAIIIDPAVTKTGDPASAQVGDIVTFTLNVFNNGNADATNVVVTDPLPVFLDYVGVSAPGATTTAYDAGTNTVTISYATVSPSDFFTILITTSVNDLGAPPGGTNTVNLVSTSADSDPANNIDDTTITIVVPSELRAPETGFAPDQITSLPVQPENLNYEAYSDISIEIPALGIKSAIVGVPLIEEGWDVTWLWNQVGYLDGTAFPGWNGNSVLTAHVYLPSGLPGPFVDLKQLAWGDQVVVQSYGTRYIFEVRESRLYRPDDRRIIRHEESPWLTLITCQRFDEVTGSYKWRRVVRGELVSTEAIQ